MTATPPHACYTHFRLTQCSNRYNKFIARAMFEQHDNLCANSMNSPRHKLLYLLVRFVSMARSTEHQSIQFSLGTRKNWRCSYRNVCPVNSVGNHFHRVSRVSRVSLGNQHRLQVYCASSWARASIMSSSITSGQSSSQSISDSAIFETILFAPGRPVPPVRRKRPKSKLFVSHCEGHAIYRVI